MIKFLWVEVRSQAGERHFLWVFFYLQILFHLLWMFVCLVQDTSPSIGSSGDPRRLADDGVRMSVIVEGNVVSC